VVALDYRPRADTSAGRPTCARRHGCRPLAESNCAAGCGASPDTWLPSVFVEACGLAR